MDVKLKTQDYHSMIIEYCYFKSKSKEDEVQKDNAIFIIIHCCCVVYVICVYVVVVCFGFVCVVCDCVISFVSILIL